MAISTELTLTIIQTSLHWNDIPANLEMFDKKLESIEDHGDVVVLPEMFSTGFSMDASKYAEEMEGRSVQWMKAWAARLTKVITGSLIIKEGGNNYNRLIWAEPSGEVKFYDKRHLFGMAGEDKNYSPGQERVIIDYRGWRICPMICYDLRFPVWSRCKDDYDLLLYVANWPEARSYAWKNLLRARAIENQAYVVGVNRVGLDGKNLRYPGLSSVIDPSGADILYEASADEEIFSIVISMENVISVRKSLPFLKDADQFEIQ